MPVEHIVAYYRHLWRQCNCIGWKVIAQGYRELTQSTR